jgi:hypothetical protein
MKCARNNCRRRAAEEWVYADFCVRLCAKHARIDTAALHGARRAWRPDRTWAI